MTDKLAENNHAIYLYCFAKQECRPLVQALTGVDVRYPVTALMDEANQDHVVAVIGEVDPAEFSEENLRTIAWLGARAQRHEAVVERVMGVSPVLPVKFGTLFLSHTSLKAFLAQHHVAIVQALNRLKGKTEWSVKGFLVEEQARPMVVAANVEIQSQLASMSASPGARYIQQRQVDIKTESAIRTWLAQANEQLKSTLIPHAVASTELRCHSSAVTGRPARMVFNTSFLLDDVPLSHFRAALSEQQRIYQGSGLTFELQGPWPPYNFCPALEGVAP